MARELLFSVTKKDLEITAIRGSGPGGQHRNKVSTGIRMKHPDSGATGESTEFKSQPENKSAAFRKLVASKTFQSWLRKRTAELMGKPSIDSLVEKAMDPKNLVIEGKENDRWTPL